MDLSAIHARIARAAAMPMAIPSAIMPPRAPVQVLPQQPIAPHTKSKTSTSSVSSLSLPTNPRKRRLGTVDDMLLSASGAMLAKSFRPSTLRTFLPSGSLKMARKTDTKEPCVAQLERQEWSQCVAGLQNMDSIEELCIPVDASSAIPFGSVQIVHDPKKRAAALRVLYAKCAWAGARHDRDMDDVWAARITFSDMARVTIIIDGVTAAHGIGVLCHHPSAAPFFIRGAGNPTTSDTCEHCDMNGWSLTAFACLWSILQFVCECTLHTMHVVNNTTCTRDDTASSARTLKDVIQHVEHMMRRVFAFHDMFMDAKQACRELCAALPDARAEQLARVLQLVTPRPAAMMCTAMTNMEEPGDEEQWGACTLSKCIAKSNLDAPTLRAFASLMSVCLPSP